MDAATEREMRARETIQSLKLEIANLTKLVEQGAGLSIGQEHRCMNIVMIYKRYKQQIFGAVLVVTRKTSCIKG